MSVKISLLLGGIFTVQVCLLVWGYWVGVQLYSAGATFMTQETVYVVMEVKHACAFLCHIELTKRRPVGFIFFSIANRHDDQYESRCAVICDPRVSEFMVNFCVYILI